MTARKSRKQWAKLLAAFERSGLPVEEFCARRRLKPGTLRWWRWQLGDRGPAMPASDVRLVPVEVVDRPERAPTPGPRGLVIGVAGVSVHVEIGTDAAYVAEIVAEIGRRC
jgi:hypothetical protein